MSGDVVARGDIIAALAEDDAYDVIYSSFVLHHLATEQKGEFFQLASRRLTPGGLLLLVDTMREEGETLDDYVRRYCAWLRREWAGLSAQEKEVFCDHIINNDRPEPFRRCSPRPAQPDWRSRLAVRVRARIGSPVLRTHRD